MRSNTFIKKEVFRTNRNLFLTNFILMLVIIFLLKGRVDTLYNSMFGPFKTELSELRKSKNTKWLFFNISKWFYELNTDSTYDPEVDAETTTTTTYLRHIKIHVSKKVSAKYAVGQIDTTLILLKVAPTYEAPIDNSGVSFTGVIANFPGDTLNYPEFVPFVLDTTKVPSNSAYWWFGICAPLLLLFIWNIIKSLSRIVFPSSHPSIKGLSTFGNTNDIIDQIENEIQNKSYLAKIDDVIITKSWLIHSDWFSFNAFNIFNIRWVYGKVEKESLGEIPFISKYAKEVFANPNDITWNSKSLIIWTNSSTNSYEIVCKELKDAAQIVDEIAQRTQKVMIGYSEELQNLWNIRREQIISLIEKNDSIWHSLEKSELKLNVNAISASKWKKKK
jgi:hypothetical protein